MDIKDKILWHNLTISNDFIFAKVMRDEKICRETLEVLLGMKIGKINYIDNQKNIDLNYDSKSVRLDVYVEDENRIYNIEMQVANKKDLPKRSRYYQGMIDLNAIEKGKLYNELKDSVIIFICKFDPFGDGLPKYTFKNICDENKKTYLKDGATKIFFNSKSFDKESSENLKYFLEYVENNTVRENNFVKKIAEKVREVKENEDWMVEFMTLKMREREIAQESFEKGMERGLEEGLERGKIEGILATIKLFREFNFSDEDIILRLVKEFNLSKEDAEKYLK